MLFRRCAQATRVRCRIALRYAVLQTRQGMSSIVRQHILRCRCTCCSSENIWTQCPRNSAAGPFTGAPLPPKPPPAWELNLNKAGGIPPGNCRLEPPACLLHPPASSYLLHPPAWDSRLALTPSRLDQPGPPAWDLKNATARATCRFSSRFFLFSA